MDNERVFTLDYENPIGTRLARSEWEARQRMKFILCPKNFIHTFYIDQNGKCQFRIPPPPSSPSQPPSPPTPTPVHPIEDSNP